MAVPNRWQFGARSVAVTEGLLLYLTEDTVRDLLETVAACSGPSSRIVFTHVEPADDGRPAAGAWTGLSRLGLCLQRRAVALVGAPDR